MISLQKWYQHTELNMRKDTDMKLKTEARNLNNVAQNNNLTTF